MKNHTCINCGYEILPTEDEESIYMSRQIRYYHATYEGCQNAQHRKGSYHAIRRTW